MSRLHHFQIAPVVLLVLGIALPSASQRALAQSAIPVRQITGVVRTDSTIFSDISRVVPLHNGTVMVNDPKRLRLLLLDNTLQKVKIVADTNAATVNKYSLYENSGGLIPFQADSTLLLDLASRSLIVVDPVGRFVRTMAPVHESDLSALPKGYNNAAATDPKGRLIVRGTTQRLPTHFPPNIGDSTFAFWADSAPILRADFEQRTVDTLAYVHVPRQVMMTVRINGKYSIAEELNPLPETDEWGMLPDGTVAIIRGHDYHVDWITPDGRRTSSPKLSFDWKRVTPEAKIEIVDSTTRALKKKAAADRSREDRWMVTKPTALPDYFPPVSPGQVHPDNDGNLWVLPTTSKLAGSGLVYDVINRKGVLIERVRMPQNCLLLAIGPDGAVYMRAVLASGNVVLERGMVSR